MLWSDTSLCAEEETDEEAVGDFYLAAVFLKLYNTRDLLANMLATPAS